MVSNFERILAEIRREAAQIAPNYQLDPETVVNLIMEIVDLQDQHRVKAQHNINVKIKQMIQDASRNSEVQ